MINTSCVIRNQIFPSSSIWNVRFFVSFHFNSAIFFQDFFDFGNHILSCLSLNHLKHTIHHNIFLIFNFDELKVVNTIRIHPKFKCFVFAFVKIKILLNFRKTFDFSIFRFIFAHKKDFPILRRNTSGISEIHN